MKTSFPPNLNNKTTSVAREYATQTDLITSFDYVELCFIVVLLRKYGVSYRNDLSINFILIPNIIASDF
jgi:hypothetical protein